MVGGDGGDDDDDLLQLVNANQSQYLAQVIGETPPHRSNAGILAKAKSNTMQSPKYMKKIIKIQNTRTMKTKTILLQAQKTPPIQIQNKKIS